MWLAISVTGRARDNRRIGFPGARQQEAVRVEAHAEISRYTRHLAVDQAGTLIESRARANTRAATIDAQDGEVVLHWSAEGQISRGCGAEPNCWKTVRCVREVDWLLGWVALGGVVAA